MPWICGRGGGRGGVAAGDRSAPHDAALIGAAVLLFIGIRTLRDAFRVRLGAEADDEVATPRRAFATSAAATASNPLTIASWGAVFAAASGVGAAGGPMLLVAGVGIGSLCWVTLLATGTAAARRALGLRAMRVADAFAGVGLIFFGCALALQPIRRRAGVLPRGLGP